MNETIAYPFPSKHFLERAAQRASFLVKRNRQDKDCPYMLNYLRFEAVWRNKKEIERPRTIYTLLNHEVKGVPSSYYLIYPSKKLKDRYIIVVQGNTLKTIYHAKGSWYQRTKESR